MTNPNNQVQVIRAAIWLDSMLSRRLGEFPDLAYKAACRFDVLQDLIEAEYDRMQHTQTVIRICH